MNVGGSYMGESYVGYLHGIMLRGINLCGIKLHRIMLVPKGIAFLSVDQVPSSNESVKLCIA